MMKKGGAIVLVLIIVLILIMLGKNTINNITELNSNIKYANKVEAIMSDDLEIERKWIIDKQNIPYDLSNVEIIKIEQTYICFSPEIRVRRINDGQLYTFAVKTNMTTDGMIRDEMENDITKEEYNNLIKKQEGNTIYKTRYQFLDGDNLIAIDIFSGDLDGLAYMEIEFENKEDANNYQTPDWVIKEVTDDINYKNGHLARYGIPNSYSDYTKNK